ncbi:hypothetical protein [Micromonospora sp. NPDC093277]|uniref:hypothetical protein n=1 Tax=Micromonospora sp. NPDC093277 TaxID=3364291 RepID=UPI00381060A0
MTVTAHGPRSLHDAATVLRSWEAALRAPAPLRGAAVLTNLHPDGDAVLDLPLAEVAALATTYLAEASGYHVEGVLECAGCGMLLDVRLRLSDLLDDPPATEGRDRGARFALRPPTPRDLAAASDDADAYGLLLRRCVSWADGTPVDPAALGPADLDEIDGALESLAGPALPLLRATCPDCGGAATGTVDVTDLLWRHVEIEAHALLRDVSQLAATFGWREADVLALSPYRRSAYLALVTG